MALSYGARNLDIFRSYKKESLVPGNLDRSEINHTIPQALGDQSRSWMLDGYLEFLLYGVNGEAPKHRPVGRTAPPRLWSLNPNSVTGGSCCHCCQCKPLSISQYKPYAIPLIQSDARNGAHTPFWGLPSVFDLHYWSLLMVAIAVDLPHVSHFSPLIIGHPCPLCGLKTVSSYFEMFSDPVKNANVHCYPILSRHIQIKW